MHDTYRISTLVSNAPISPSLQKLLFVCSILARDDPQIPITIMTRFATRDHTATPVRLTDCTMTRKIPLKRSVDHCG